MAEIETANDPMALREEVWRSGITKLLPAATDDQLKRIFEILMGDNESPRAALVQAIKRRKYTRRNRMQDETNGEGTSRATKKARASGSVLGV